MLSTLVFLLILNFTLSFLFQRLNQSRVNMSLDPLKNLSALQDKYFFRVPHAHIIADYIWPVRFLKKSKFYVCFI